MKADEVRRGIREMLDEVRERLRSASIHTDFAKDALAARDEDKLKYHLNMAMNLTQDVLWTFHGKTDDRRTTE